MDFEEDQLHESFTPTCRFAFAKVKVNLAFYTLQSIDIE